MPPPTMSCAKPWRAAARATTEPVSKLLEAYADLRARTGQPVPAAVQGRLLEWQAVGSLKKAAVSLLA